MTDEPLTDEQAVAKAISDRAPGVPYDLMGRVAGVAMDCLRERGWIAEPTISGRIYTVWACDKCGEPNESNESDPGTPCEYCEDGTMRAFQCVPLTDGLSLARERDDARCEAFGLRKKLEARDEMLALAHDGEAQFERERDEARASYRQADHERGWLEAERDSALREIDRLRDALGEIRAGARGVVYEGVVAGPGELRRGELGAIAERALEGVPDV